MSPSHRCCLTLILLFLFLASPAPRAGAVSVARDADPIPSRPQTQPAYSTLVAGSAFTCGLTVDGGVRCWGNDDGRPAYVPGLLDGVVALAGADAHACAVLATGAVMCWGENFHGQLGDGTLESRPAPVQVVGLSGPAVGVTAGAYWGIRERHAHTCALLADGRVECWGRNAAGQLGDGSTVSRTTPAPVVGLGGRATAVTAGGAFTCAIMEDGGVRCWGAGVWGTLGNDAWENSATPVSVVGLPARVTALAAGTAPGATWEGAMHVCALTESGMVLCWGNNWRGQLGDGTTTRHSVPAVVNDLGGPAVAIAAGGLHSCAAIAGAAVKCWGGNTSGQLGDGSLADRTTPVAVVRPGGSAFTGASALAAGGRHTCAIVGGEAWCWGDNASAQLGDGLPVWRTTAAGVNGLPAPVVAVDAGAAHVCARTTDGRAACWGANFAGQLGDGTLESHGMPGLVAGLSAVRSVAAGESQSCAVLATGGVKCWGNNASGELGDGTTVDRLTPVDVVSFGGPGSGPLTGALQVTAGSYHGCAVLAGGSAACWGGNGWGQLGSGDQVNRSTPALVSGLASGVQVLTGGGAHTCALTTAGGVKCWGWNDYGQVGDGTKELRPAPVDVVGLGAGVASVSAGFVHSCAVTSGGAAKCWGDNLFGALGNGSDEASPVPVDVVGLQHDVVSIASGAYHSCALRSAGDVVCWGRNYFGSLGNGTRDHSCIPVSVQGLTARAVSLTAGYDFTCALLEDGRVGCWGGDQDGALGAGRAPLRTTAGPVVSARPALLLSHRTGRPGSRFAVIALDFAPDSPLELHINGHEMVPAPLTGSTGRSEFAVDASAADAGFYRLDVGGDPGSSTWFVVRPGAPAREYAGAGGVLAIPPGWGEASWSAWLPAVAR